MSHDQFGKIPQSPEIQQEILQAELAALDRKIAAELAPTHEVQDDRMGVNHDEKDGEEVKPDTRQQPTKVIESPPSSQSQSTDDKSQWWRSPHLATKSSFACRNSPRSVPKTLQGLT